MSRARVLAIVLLTLLWLPLGFSLREIFSQPQAASVFSKVDRLASLAQSSLLIAAGAAGIAFSLGVPLAFLLYRGNLPGSAIWRWLFFLPLFIPLPMFAAAWQGVLGHGGFLPWSGWTWVSADDPDQTLTGQIMKPWAIGLPAAVWVHAMAALPWVVLMVGQGFLWVEAELEEDARLAAPPWRVFWRVTFRRSRAAWLAALLWAAMTPLCEITVTDMMQVRTYAEEIYTQIVLGDQAAFARAVLVALPWVFCLALLVWVATRGWERNLPPLDTWNKPPPAYHLEVWKAPAVLAIAIASGLLLAIPIASLGWKLGYQPGSGWSAATAWLHMASALKTRGLLVVQSLFQAAGSGLIAATLALVISALAIGSRILQSAMLLTMAALLAWPAPLVGMGLKNLISAILDGIPIAPVANALYYGPSPLPVIWAQVTRFIPIAVALIWPILRLVPTELRDAASMDGAGPWAQIRHVYWPFARQAFFRSALCVAVLSLGELGAGKLVETPGGQNFAHEVFSQMHYGVTNDLAALCLLLFAAVLVGSIPLAYLSIRQRPA